jgi:hypothetical protein
MRRVWSAAWDLAGLAVALAIVNEILQSLPPRERK